jgi:hypothetical protein
MARVDIQWVPAERAHIRHIASNMRPADCAEAWATALLSPQAALEQSLAVSVQAWTGLADGVPYCMFGVATSASPDVGVPWLLGTADLERNAIAFLRRNHGFVDAMLERFPRLINHVDARNRTSIRWLQWIGFTIGRPQPYGPFAMPFHPFELRR